MKNISRRDFVKNAAIVGIGSSIALPGISKPAISSEALSINAGGAGKKVIVAGAGITGLCCGYELMMGGHDVTVLEGSGRSGGHVFTSRDGLSDGLYTDLGADHITMPGYERFFEYIKEFGLEALPYPGAEGSADPQNRNALRMINGKFYSDEMMSDPGTLKQFGFNDRETAFLSTHPAWELRSLFLKPYLNKFTDPFQPFGVGYDDYDHIPISDIYNKEGASEAAMRFLGGGRTSALYTLWRMFIMESRGIPLSEGKTFRLKGGNSELPKAFARKLGSRLKLGHSVLSIEHSTEGVSVTYKTFGYEDIQIMKADYLVNCISMPVFRSIAVSPQLPAEKQYVVDNLSYTSHPFYVFEAESKFWLDHGLKTINIEFEHSDIFSIWQEVNELDTERVILKANAPAGLSAQRVLAAFREVYPGKGKDTITQAITKDWTSDPYAPGCEMQPFPIGEMHRFWPEIMKPVGRIYFAGTYADNLSRGMESCLRSANRVAKEISAVT